jgi:hypothetical protein
LSLIDLFEAIAELHSTTVSVQVAGDRPYTKSGPILADVERETEETAAAKSPNCERGSLVSVIGPHMVNPRRLGRPPPRPCRPLTATLATVLRIGPAPCWQIITAP